MSESRSRSIGPSTRLRADFRVRLAAAGTDAAVKALADEFLSRKSGSVTGLMKTLGSLAPDARREFGALVNALKQEIETAVEERRRRLRRRVLPPARLMSPSPRANGWSVTCIR